MKKYIPILKNTKLFAGMDDVEIQSVLSCLNAKIHYYKKSEYVLHQGDNINCVYLILDGALHIQSDDYWGNRTILEHIPVGEVFAEAYATANCQPINNDVVAIEDCVILSLDTNRIPTTCPSVCKHHTKIIQNMIYTVSAKNIQLVQKIRHISKRTTREKLMSYLSLEAKLQNSSDFDIPYNRQQLADYLAIDRSAMSNQLCKMRDDGLIRFYKNHFELL
ncbi:MAG: Crp/Fnr family transcriptional regulator [Eubacterium sp.]